VRLDEDSQRVCMVVKVHRSRNFNWESIPIDLAAGQGSIIRALGMVQIDYLNGSN
jgi:hypothetical protein